MHPLVSQSINERVSNTAAVYETLSNPQLRGRIVCIIAIAAAAIMPILCIYRYATSRFAGLPKFPNHIDRFLESFQGALLSSPAFPPTPRLHQIVQPVCKITEQEILRVMELELDAAISSEFMTYTGHLPAQEGVIRYLARRNSRCYPELKGIYEGGLHVIDQCSSPYCGSAVACACMIILDIKKSLDAGVFVDLFWFKINAYTESTLNIVIDALEKRQIQCMVKRVDDLNQLKDLIDHFGPACLPICGQHYVMVDKVDGGEVWLRDPSEGRAIVLSEKSFKRYWGSSFKILQLKQKHGKNPRNGSPSE